MAKGAALVDILEVVVLQQKRKSCDANLQRQRELQKQNKTTTTTTPICLISELSFPPYRRGWGIQQSVILADSALIVQSITLLYTIFD